jgi:hypothetical protein
MTPLSEHHPSRCRTAASRRETRIRPGCRADSERLPWTRGARPSGLSRFGARQLGSLVWNDSTTKQFPSSAAVRRLQIASARPNVKLSRLVTATRVPICEPYRCWLSTAPQKFVPRSGVQRARAPRTQESRQPADRERGYVAEITCVPDRRPRGVPTVTTVAEIASCYATLVALSLHRSTSRHTVRRSGSGRTGRVVHTHRGKTECRQEPIPCPFNSNSIA